jgi:sugar phosphate isomerase/epimerase
VNFAVSNIAWPKEQDAAVAGVLTGLSVTGIEVAPTKAWPSPLAATPAEVEAYRRFWNERGLSIVAAQALLFGRPELTIFEAAETRAKTLDYLTGIVRLCAQLGAKALVFGSPKNRRVGNLPADEVRRIACDFFGRLGEVAAAAGTTVVMEANPPEYGADFVTQAGDAVELVKAVNHPGFRLHLDTGCMTLADDPIRETFAAGASLVRHIHVSEPNLDPPGTSGRVDHAAFAAELARHGYPGWVSLEMREPKEFTLDGFAASVKWMTERYAAALPRRAAG